MILVVGATGLLGGRITAKLLAQGKQVRILVRHDSPSSVMAQQGMATAAETLIQAGAEPVYGDLRDRTSLDAACQGVETVITTANTVLRDNNYEEIDLKGTSNLIDAAKAADAGHFIYTSTSSSDINSPIPFLKVKGMCEQYLKESGINYTILQPGIFMEIWVGAIVGGPLRAQQPVTLVGKGDHAHAFVAIEDVANFAVAAVDNPNAVNQSIFIAGPASYSWTEIVNRVSSTLGFPIPVNYVGFDDPIPVPPGMDVMLRGHETYESHIDMSETAPKYGVVLTPLEEFARRFFAAPA
jgi:NADH dehydrogenase